MNKLAVFCSTLALSLSAYAHGPSPLKTDVTVTINAPAAKVWSVVRDFNNLPQWNPAVKSSKTEKKGEATYRNLTLQSGETLVEKLRQIDEQDMAVKVEMEEGTLPVSSYNSRISVKDLSGGKTEVRWFGRYYRKYMLNPPIPKGQDDESAKAAVDGLYQKGLDNLKKTLESR